MAVRLRWAAAGSVLLRATRAVVALPLLLLVAAEHGGLVLGPRRVAVRPLRLTGSAVLPGGTLSTWTSRARRPGRGLLYRSSGRTGRTLAEREAASSARGGSGRVLQPAAWTWHGTIPNLDSRERCRLDSVPKPGSQSRSLSGPGPSVVALGAQELAEVRDGEAYDAALLGEDEPLLDEPVAGRRKRRRLAAE